MPNELVGLYVEENPRSCLRAGDGADMERGRGTEDCPRPNIGVLSRGNLSKLA